MKLYVAQTSNTTGELQVVINNLYQLNQQLHRYPLAHLVRHIFTNAIRTHSARRDARLQACFVRGANQTKVFRSGIDAAAYSASPPPHSLRPGAS